MFDILVQAMGAGGNLEKIQEKTLPPRKRAGWTGGDDRGPSSKSAAKQADVDIDQQAPQGELKSSSVDISEQETPKEGRGGASVTNSSREDHSTSNDVAPSNAKKSDQQNTTSDEIGPDIPISDRDRDAVRGSAGNIEVEGGGKGKSKDKVKGGEGPAQAGEGVARPTGETVVVKRVVDEGQEVGFSAAVGGGSTCKRGRTETDGAGIV